MDLAEKEFIQVGRLDEREITTSLGKRLLMILSPFGMCANMSERMRAHASLLADDALHPNPRVAAIRGIVHTLDPAVFACATILAAELVED